jgi:sugar phosphate isomerase/epimerase
MSTAFEADAMAYARSGWTAVELWLTKLEAFLESHSVAEAQRLLDDQGLDPVAASFQGGLLLTRGDERRVHWEHFRRRLDLLQQMKVPILTIAADFTAEPNADDYARAAAALSEAALAASNAGVRLALEFQKGARFCASLDTALALIAHSGAEDLGVCLDVFHYYAGPSKFEDLAYLTPANLALVQVCDLSGVPRELAGDSDRILPGDGDFQLGPILDQIAAIGYNGYVSLEVLNPQLWQISADRVADFGFQALCRVLGKWHPPDSSGGY